MRKRNRNFGVGPGGSCVCPNCGKEIEHQRGISCLQTSCPECGSAMIRKELSSYLVDIANKIGKKE